MLTDEIKTDIIQRLREGASLMSAARENGVTAGAFYNAMSNDEGLRDEYVRARESGIDSQAEEMHDLEMRVLNGEIDPNAFRAAMDARKWRMARQAPKKYGDKMTQEITGKDGGAIEIEHKISPITKSALDDLLGR